MTTKRKAVAGRYRAIRTRAWEHFAHQDSDSVKLLLYLWIGPHSAPFGILRLKDAYVVADLSWEMAQLQQAWQALQGADLVWRDGELAVVVPYLQSNPPPNPNVMIGWGRNLAELPDSPLYARLYAKALEWLSEEDLTWLQDKIAQSPPNRSETVPELRSQVSGRRPSGPRDQAPARSAREKGTGEVQEGERGGPDTARLAPSSQRDGSPTYARLVELFMGHDPEGTRRIARQNKFSEAEIDAAEREAAKAGVVTQANM